MSILRKVEFEQADFMWQYQLRYERDVVAQVRHSKSRWGGFRTTLLDQEFKIPAVLAGCLVAGCFSRTFVL